MGIFTAKNPAGALNSRQGRQLLRCQQGLDARKIADTRLDGRPRQTQAIMPRCQ